MFLEALHQQRTVVLGGQELAKTIKPPSKALLKTQKQATKSLRTTLKTVGEKGDELFDKGITAIISTVDCVFHSIRSRG